LKVDKEVRDAAKKEKSDLRKKEIEERRLEPTVVYKKKEPKATSEDTTTDAKVEVKEDETKPRYQKFVKG
jgi:hypothetical protein